MNKNIEHYITFQYLKWAFHCIIIRFIHWNPFSYALLNRFYYFIFLCTSLQMSVAKKTHIETKMLKYDSFSAFVDGSMCLITHSHEIVSQTFCVCVWFKIYDRTKFVIDTPLTRVFNQLLKETTFSVSPNRHTIEEIYSRVLIMLYTKLRLRWNDFMDRVKFRLHE